MPGSSSETRGRRGRPLLLALALAVPLAGCGGQAFDYRSEREIPPGPGLFTGEAGALTIGLGGRSDESRNAAGPAQGLPPAPPPAGGYAEP